MADNRPAATREKISNFSEYAINANIPLGRFLCCYCWCNHVLNLSNFRTSTAEDVKGHMR